MRILVWFCLGFSAACCAGAYLIRGMGLLWLMAAGVGLLLGGVLLRKKWNLSGIPLILLAGFGAGCGLFFGYDAVYLEPIRALDGETREIMVTVSDFSRETDYGCTVNGRVRLEDHNYSILLYLDEPIPLTPGDRVAVPATLRFTDEGGGQEPTYHRSNGVLLLAEQADEATIHPGEPAWIHQPALLRSVLQGVLRTCFLEDTCGFARALFLGDKTGLEEDVTLAFRLAGLSHIVAVSGLHVSVLFAFVYVLAGKRPLLTALLGIPTVLLFAALAGFTPSVTRAAVMEILIMLAMVAKREYDPPTALAAAVLVMLVLNPLVITSAGFQMSVSSVAGIFWLYPDLYKRLGGTQKKKNWKNQLRRGLASALSLSLSASVPVIPLVAYYYGTVSLVSVVANLLVVPVIQLVFYGIGLVCLVGLMLPVVGSAIAQGISWGIRYVLGMAKVLASFPLAAVYTQSIYVTLWLVFCFALVLWYVICKPERIHYGVLTGILALCCALLLSWMEPLTDDYRVTVLDVGQGQCVLLQSRGNTFMVDCGGDSDAEAGNRAAEMLLGMGIRHLDGLILTHYDRDHVGGVPYLAGRIAIARVYLPQTADTDGLRNPLLLALADSERILLETDTEIRAGECTIRIFVPKSGKSGNESCAAVLFQNEKYDTLIIGDRSAPGERELLASGVVPDLEVLIVGHHGSNDSTCPELLYRTAPEIAIISVGKNNSYGHPRPEVLERLRQYGCTVYRTDLMGNLVFRG